MFTCWGRERPYNPCPGTQLPGAVSRGFAAGAVGISDLEAAGLPQIVGGIWGISWGWGGCGITRCWELAKPEGGQMSSPWGSVAMLGRVRAASWGGCFFCLCPVWG